MLRPDEKVSNESLWCTNRISDCSFFSQNSFELLTISYTIRLSCFRNILKLIRLWIVLIEFIHLLRGGLLFSLFYVVILPFVAYLFL